MYFFVADLTNQMNILLEKCGVYYTRKKKKIDFDNSISF